MSQKGCMMGRVTAALGLILVTTGCYEHTFTVGRGATTGPVVYQEWHNHWLGGLIGEKTLEVDTLCPSGNATIHDEQTFLNGFVSALTGGIYTPTTVKIQCDSGRTSVIELSADDVRDIVGSAAFLERVEQVLPGRWEEAQRSVRAQEEDH